MSTESAQTTCMHCYKNVKHLQTPCSCVSRLTCSSSLSIDDQLLAANWPREKSGCVPKLLWLARLNSIPRIACLLHNFVTSRCVDPSFKLAKKSIWADSSSGESKTHHNGVQGEQITLETVNKAFIQKSKTTACKLEILSCYACTTFASAWFFVTFEKCKLQTYRYTDTHIHEPTTICLQCMHTKA